MATYSIDLRKRVMDAVSNGMRPTTAAKTFSVSRRVIYRWKKLLKATGNLKPKSGFQKGHSHKIVDLEEFKNFVLQYGGLTVKMMVVEWTKLKDQTISESTMERALKKIDFTSKKNFNYIEADEEKREQYLEEIKNIDPANIVYSDETGIDDNEVPIRGWAPRGQRFYAKKNGVRKTRYNITAALNQGKLFAPFVFEGYSNAIVYETYVEKILAPNLKPGMVVVIDNAQFHKSKKVIQLIEDMQCRIIFLPPYSPDLNPIEHLWSATKTKIRRTAETIHDFYEAAVITVGDMCLGY